MNKLLLFGCVAALASVVSAGTADDVRTKDDCFLNASPGETPELELAIRAIWYVWPWFPVDGAEVKLV